MAVYVFLAQGFEESEAIITVDFLIRAGLEVILVGADDTSSTMGSHNIEIATPCSIQSVNIPQAEALVFPGGLPGSVNLANNPHIPSLISAQLEQGGLVAAICAAPIRVLLAHGFLDGKNYTCYPSEYDEQQHGGIGTYIADNSVVIDGTIITSQGIGTTTHFAHAIIRTLRDVATADNVIEATLSRTDWTSYSQ